MKILKYIFTLLLVLFSSVFLGSLLLHKHTNQIIQVCENYKVGTPVANLENDINSKLMFIKVTKNEAYIYQEVWIEPKIKISNILFEDFGCTIRHIDNKVSSHSKNQITGVGFLNLMYHF